MSDTASMDAAWDAADEASAQELGTVRHAPPPAVPVQATTAPTPAGSVIADAMQAKAEQGNATPNGSASGMSAAAALSALTTVLNTAAAAITPRRPIIPTAAPIPTIAPDPPTVPPWGWAVLAGGAVALLLLLTRKG